MPSSLIIVALAAAWLVVLVPMVARKRQEVARTGDDALTSRVVRSGSAGSAGSAPPDREEIGMSEITDDPGFTDEADDLPADEMDAPEEYVDDYAELPAEEYADERPPGRYRPGRGGFDPQAAELAARAKYAFRQRVVLALIATVVISVVLAVALTPLAWYLTGAAFAGLTGYLAYLRRQVRIENEIRERRLARLGGARSQARRREADLEADYDREIELEHEYRLADEAPMAPAGVERKPRPQPRAPRRNAVVVDVEDEDPAFHELAEPGPPAYRRAVGE